MNHNRRYILCILAGIIASAAFGQTPDKYDQIRERNAWLEKCIAEFTKAKAGMTRSEIEAIFPQDGGLQSFYEIRYSSPYCSYFKIDIAYNATLTTNYNGRHIPGPADVATNISRPYLEYPYND